MKTAFYTSCIFYLVIFIACSGKNKSNQSHNKLTKDEVSGVVKEYLTNKLKNPIEGENEGLIRIQGDEEVCIFSRDKIFIGKLDNNESEDAIVTYGYQKTDEMATDRHIILLNDSVLHVVNDFQYAMTIQGISSRMIIALVDTGKKAMNTAPCALCRELREYKLNGDTIEWVKN